MYTTRLALIIRRAAVSRALAVRGGLLMAALAALCESGYIVAQGNLRTTALGALFVVAFSLYGALALALSLALRDAPASRAAALLLFITALMGGLEKLNRRQLSHPDATIASLLPEVLLRLIGSLLLAWLLDALLRRRPPLRLGTTKALVAAWLACCLLTAAGSARIYRKASDFQSREVREVKSLPGIGSPKLSDGQRPSARSAILEDHASSFPTASEAKPVTTTTGDGRSALLLLIDTLRTSALGCYGQPEEVSPHLDALSRRGRLFAENRSQASWTKASTASIFTSLHPSEHGAAPKKAVLPPGVTTLAEQFRDRGFLTLGFSANGSVSPIFHMNQGFIEFTYLDTMDELGQAVYRLIPLKFASSVLGLPIHFAPLYGATADLLVGAVGLRVERLDEEAPVFLYVHFMDPHSPYLSPPGGTFARKVQNFAGTRPLALSAYLDEVRFTDRQVARLLRSIRLHPAFRDVVLAVTADHGEEFYEHGGISHGYTLFDELLRVPFILSGETVKAGIETRPTQGIDLAPTLLAACGVDAPPAFEGRNLSSAFEDEDLLFEEEFGEIRLESLKSSRLKLISGQGKDGKETLLFDLESDPGESTPLSSAPDERRLLDKTRSMRRKRATAATPIDDAERDRQLRALGYLN